MPRNEANFSLREAYLPKIAPEMPDPTVSENIFNTIRYRRSVSVQGLGYFPSTVSYIKVQTMFK